jgi:hypothetical protein
MLLYPHHRGLAQEEGMISVHQIANKKDHLIGIATVSLFDPKKVGPSLKKLLSCDGPGFTFAAAEPSYHM